MPLAPGVRLGVYEIQAAIGAGGMGEVYRARDTELNRDVAVKVLPDAFAVDPDRVARFKREAQLLASLNHPNIAAIYGLEQADGLHALVLELVDGPTLADRLARGPLELDDAVSIARQVADALEAAHDQGVVHRDLKPANIKLRADGTVKVLDFGLAKALDPISTAPDSLSPTMTSPAMTRLGVILGTAAYMAPEQARGRAVDRRADIWAFGCVLFEMLTGRRAFEGEDVAETLGAVIHKEPDWNAVPAATPPWVRALLRRCLQKDPKKRLPHIGIARIEIDEPPAGEATPAGAAVGSRPPLWSARTAWLVATLAAAVAVALGMMMYVADRAVDAPVMRASILPPAGVSWANLPPNTTFALSPDGRRLAFLGTDAAGTRLWVRPLEALTAQPLTGTEGVVLATWSPDSRFLAFVATDGRLRRIDASGGPPITLADKASVWGLAWSTEDDLLFVPDARSPIFRVPSSGGAPSQVTTLDPTSGDTAHVNPFFLPDGRHFLYVALGDANSPIEPRAVYVGSLDAVESPRLLENVYNPKYASGYLLFTRETTLMAQRFDTGRLELSGEAAPLAEQLRLGGATGLGAAVFPSQTGTLIYQTGSADLRSQLTWYDRAGKPMGVLGEPADQTSVELSPDGTRALASLLDSTRRGRDLWIYDVGRNLRTRFTFDPAVELMGTWSPDGRRVVFNSSRRAGFFDLYAKASDGSGAEELLVSDDQVKEPYGWSPDGRILAYSGFGVRTLQDLWTVTLAGDRKPAVFLQTPFIDARPRISPDGRWLAYSSNESGRAEIYVTTFPDRSGKWQVSAAGGNFPRWRRDGKEIFYLSPDYVLMAADVRADAATFQFGEARRLFEVRRSRPAQAGGQAGYPYDVSPDGQRFLVNTLLEETSTTTEPLTLVVNWPALLRR